MERPTRLSGRFVRGVKEPGRYGDGRGGFGLALVVAPTAAGGLSKAFVQRIRVNGRPTNIGLGSFPLVRLDEAREAALQNARAIRNGANPLADRKRRAGIPTFEQATERVIATHSESWKGGSRTAGIWRARLGRYVYPSLGALRVDTVSSSDVLGVIAPLWAEKRETASKVRSYINAVMAWAIAEGHRSDNPVDAIGAALPRAGAKVNHQRALAYAEVRGALAKIWESDAYEVTKLAIEYLTLTAARSGEVRGATWDEVDEYTHTWTIPGLRTKTGREHRVPLSAAAIAVLEQAREYADNSGFVFPSVAGRILSDNTLSKLFRELGIAGTPHGMRSSFRDWAAEKGGVPREIAEFALGHVEGSGVELAYRRTDFFEQRRALMERWAAAIGS